MAIETGGDLRADAALGQPQIQDREIRSVLLPECDRHFDGASDAAHFIPTPDQHILEHVSHEEIVFGYHDLEHLALPVGMR